MKIHRTSRRDLVVAVSLVSIAMASAGVSAQQDAGSEASLEEVFVTAKSVSFGNNTVTDSMKAQQSPITSVNALIDNLPGVSIQEGDTYGFDDWSTTISVRGFQNTLDTQQIGSTIDGMPNGNSNYGGGAKANRYIDSANIETVSVSQGTADIASRSLEALGGTIDYVTSDPTEESRFRAQGSVGEFDARRYYLRYDTGMLGESTRAWVSVSQQEASDWVNGAAENERDHIAAKLVSQVGIAEIKAYISYDDTHEDNYQRLFSPEEFVANAESDRLTETWTGIPYQDQVYRRGWSTLRENLLGYVTADLAFTETLNLKVGAYYHDNEGRGDWLPPYLVNVVDDMGGPESEFTGNAGTNGGPFLGQIFFVDANGATLSPADGCVSSITFPYGGAGPQYDPACYADGAIPVGSFRNTNYEKERAGLMVDGDWTADLAGFTNTLRGGIWYEDQTRDETRTWHKITDSRVEFAADPEPYWTQYNRSYPQEVFKWYVEDTVDIGAFSLTAGVKQFLVDVAREDNFQETTDVSIDSDSDVLLSAGVVWQTPIDGLEVFAGYSENFKAVSDNILERPDSDLSVLEPETAENQELGLRYRGDRLFLTATYYQIDFSNRIIFLGAESVAGPNYLIGDTGTYFNAGGIDSTGFEVTADLRLTDSLSLYSAYSLSDSTYIGTGDPLVDAGLGVVPGNDVTGIPDQQLVMSLDWSWERFSAGISAKYTGERPVRLDNSWIADSYTTADAYLTVTGGSRGDFLQGWNISLLVNNAFDEDYLGGISGQGAWIGAPRTVSASFTVDF
ncbi:TonB-dependent receptor domain-containing protein [Congregibacter litoralis]|uniref:Outer membrane receptor protein, mostly Fe transport n=1 Tax=Congregibacter litoralis KT71 TaxID=314285 RepID=A4A6Z4_9GAMM|nr:TonB-dependent receptor [Congregibacter litoralis]EAQ98063.1 Outer membrane receptor protein, mostly Fe transport [Congregibacter litoralis KT71]